MMTYDETWGAVLATLAESGRRERADLLREIAAHDGRDILLALDWAKGADIYFTKEIVDSVKALVANGELEPESLTLI